MRLVVSIVIAVASIVIAVAYALLIRLIFGHRNMEVMSDSFLMLSPFVIGFLNIILLRKGSVRSAIGAFALPWLTVLMLLVITILFNIEGAICWIMIYPVYALAAGIGGLVAYYIRHRRYADKTDDWDFMKNNEKRSVSLLLLLPCITGVIEGDRLQHTMHREVSETIIIAASPNAVWARLVQPVRRSPAKSGSFWSSAIGFPGHVSTTLDTLQVGARRYSYYQKGLVFEEAIRQIIPAKKLVLSMKTDPRKIPANVMDEHIVIGGKYVDVEEDTYTLQETEAHTTRVTLASRYRIHTPFNWYAGLWSDFLMKDVLGGELKALAQ